MTVAVRKWVSMFTLQCYTEDFSLPRTFVLNYQTLPFSFTERLEFVRFPAAPWGSPTSCPQSGWQYRSLFNPISTPKKLMSVPLIKKARWIAAYACEIRNPGEFQRLVKAKMLETFKLKRNAWRVCLTKCRNPRWMQWLPKCMASISWK